MGNYLGLCEELCISIITLTSLDKQMEDPKAGGMTWNYSSPRINLLPLLRGSS